MSICGVPKIEKYGLRFYFGERGGVYGVSGCHLLAKSALETTEILWAGAGCGLRLGTVGAMPESVQCSSAIFVKVYT